MRLANVNWFKELVASHLPPCVSIYLPINHADPTGKENPVRYRDQLKEVHQSLARDYRERDIRPLMDALKSVPEDKSFWTAARDAVAIFASPDFLRVIDIQRSIDPKVFVGDTFHIKPLIRVMQSDWKYHVLTLTQQQVRMFLGSGEALLTALDSSMLPQNPAEVSKMRQNHQISVNEDLRTPPTQFPDEGTQPAPVATMDHFMRAVDGAVWENFSRDSGLPLILAAVEHYHPEFHAISKNAHLLPEGIKHDPQQMSVERLHQEAWAIMRPRFQARIEDLKNRYMAAKARHRGSDELIEVVEAAVNGRVDTLLVDGSRQITGRFDPGTGRIEPSRAEDPRADDILDDLTEMVLKTDGEAFVLTPEMMPNDTGLAAIYRY